MSTQGLSFEGRWTVQVIGPDGVVKEQREKKNLIVSAGLNWIREFLLDSVTPTAAARMGWIAIGSDATAVSAANTALGTELARGAVANYTAGGTGVASIDYTFGAGTGTGAISEAGTFNASSAGTMLNRVVFSTVTKGASDSLKVTFTLTIANA